MPQATVNRDAFKKLSVALTGVSDKQLSPGVDPIRLVEQYCHILETCLDPQRLADVINMLGQVDKTPVEELLADEKFGPLARSILKMWFLGAWYDPRTPDKLLKVISSQAYKESLVWRAMQSHPMGYSTLPFGHWSREPMPLNSFFVFAPPKGANNG
jgi:hypothetical protein